MVVLFYFCQNYINEYEIFTLWEGFIRKLAKIEKILIALLVLTLLALGSSITINFLWKYIRIMYEKMHIFLLSREKRECNEK